MHFARNLARHRPISRVMRSLLAPLATCYLGPTVKGASLLFILGLALFAAPSVHAQPRSSSTSTRSVLVLPIAVGEVDPALQAARASSLVSAIASGTHTALPLDAARTRFDELASSDPPSVTENDIERWLALSRTAVRHLARTDYAAARETLLEAQRLSDRAAEELNRELNRARQVLDTCLYDVRAYVETNDPRAESRAIECRRLVPRVEPSPYNHTPEVVELLRRVDRNLAEAPPGSLRIESQPSGCGLRLNGVQFGNTPFVSEDLAPGEYRAQVECDPTVRGRVHRIRIGAGTSTVRIDGRFDAAVRTDAAVRLVYGDAAQAERAVGDALEIANVVGVNEVWLMWADADGERWRVDRVDVSEQRVLASVLSPPSMASLTASALIAGRSEDRDEAGVRPMARWEPGQGANGSEEAAAGESGDSGDVASIAVGSSLAVLGVGSFVAAAVLYDWRSQAGGQVSLAADAVPGNGTLEGYVEWKQTWEGRRWSVLGASLAGAALTTGALPFLLPPEEGVPWWSYLVAGAGVGLVTAGALEIGTASTCAVELEQGAGCVAAAEAVDRGMIWLTASVPFLSVPLIHALRLAVGPTAQASVAFDRDGGMIRMGGAF
jgi:PEGA domain